MEHANSTAIGASSTEAAITIAAHEFFHLWNENASALNHSSRLTIPREMYTRSLWFAEGVTSTYAAYTEVRTTLWTPNQFYKDLANQIQRITRHARRANGKAWKSPA